MSAAAAEGGIILLGQNLLFAARVETAAAPGGRPVRQARTLAEFREVYAAGDISLLLVDLEGDAATWQAVLAELQSQAAAGPPGLHIVAFGPHEDTAAMARARELGCAAVLNKGRFAATLGQLVSGG